MTQPDMPAAASEKDSSKPVKVTYRGEGSGWFQATAWRIGQVFFQFIAVLLFQMRARGRQNVPPVGGALLVTNHQSFLDPWLIGVPLWRQIHYMARESLFRGGFWQWMLESTNAFPIRRGRADSAAIREALGRLERGFLVNVFPEATRSADGTIGPIASGVAIIVRRSRVPVVPVVIDGAFEAWPRGQTFPHFFRPIKLIYGKPIAHETLAQLSADEVSVLIREAMIKLQEDVNSPHAAASRRRLAEDLQRGKRRLVVAEELSG